MNIRKIKEIIKFDVERNMQNKWFIILNVFMLIVALIATNISNIDKYLEDNEIDILDEETITIEILDNGDIAYNSFLEEFEENEQINIEKVYENNYSKENIPEDNTILIEVSLDEENVILSKIVTKESIDNKLYDEIYSVLKEVRSEVFAEKNNLKIEELELLNTSLNIEREYLGIDAENADTKEMVKTLSVVVLYMVLIFVLARIANEIAQEKVSKSIEYVLTSVSAKEYLIAKVLGATISIIIQIIYSIIYYVIGNLVSNLISGQTVETAVTSLGTIDMSVVNYIAVMIIYLIFTVFLTTLIQAALSSKTTSVAEAGNTTLLLMSITMVLYFISIAVISPYNKVSIGMYMFSCLPVVSTFFVPSMMIIGQATIWQIIISFVLLIISIPLVFNKSAKYFKNGILDYTSVKRKGLFTNKENKNLSVKEQQELDLRKRKAKKVGFVVGLAMMLLVILELLCSLIISPVLAGLFKDKIETSTLILIQNSAILIISLGLTSLLIKVYDTDEIKKEKKKINYFEYILGGIAVIAVIQLFISWLYPMIGLDHSIFDAIDVMPNNTLLGNIVFIIGIAVVPAIFEELLFRKYLLGFSKKLGASFAVLFSALLFGLYHMNYNQAIFAFLIGLLFGIIAVQTGSIKPTIILHFLNNLYAALLSIISVDSIWFKVIDKGTIALAILGGLVLIKNIGKIKNIKKEDIKINSDAKLLLKNYTFLVAMALLIILVLVTEKMITTI